MINKVIPNDVIERFIELKDARRLDSVQLIDEVISMDYEAIFAPFTKDDFFKYFYQENDIISKAFNGITHSIENNHRFHFLHSYGKNGKSTFLKFLEYKTKKEPGREKWIYLEFDFKREPRHLSSSQSDSLKHKCKTFFYHYLLPKPFGTKSSEAFETNLKKLNSFVIDCQEKLGFGTDAPVPNSLNYSRIFDSFISFFRSKSDEFISAAHNSGKRDQFHKEIDDKILNLPEDEMGKLLCFIILFLIYQNKSELEKNRIDEPKRSKLILLFDNLDDIKSNTSVLAYSNSAEYIDGFLKYLNLKPIREAMGNIPTHDISIIFSYRTANLINAIHNYKKEFNKSENERDTHDYTKTFLISTIKNAPKILEQRVNFYHEVCKSLGIKADPRIDLINRITFFSDDKIEYKSGEAKRIHFSGKKEAEDFNKIFKLLNGNRTYIVDLIKEQGVVELFSNFDLFSEDYLKKGVFIFLFLSILNKRKSREMHRAVEYLFITFNGDIIQQRPSLKRLLLTYIINTTDRNPQSKNFQKVDSIVGKGVSLLSILEYFEKKSYFEDYTQQDFQEFFDAIFHDEIDDWGHLLTCYKSTKYVDNDGTVRVGKYLNFKDELDIFFSGDSLKRNKLDSIRFFYNANAEYLINHVIKHFEYYSHFEGNAKPLIGYSEFKFESGRYKFEFEEAVEKVFKRVTRCITSITNFFIKNHFGSSDALRKFEDSELAVNNRLFYSDVISKHITYLDQFRMGLKEIYLKEHKEDSSVDLELLLENLNEKTSMYIDGYLGLFQMKTLGLKDAGLDLTTNLINTRKAFTELQNTINEIKRQNYSTDSFISISN